MMALEDNPGHAASALGFWGRLWKLLEAAEMSSDEYRDLRIDALERYVANLETELHKQALARAPGMPLEEKAR